MAQAAPSLDELLRGLDSLDATERLEALDSLKRYAGHRKVMQAVFELRNDPDRNVRTVARAILEEGDKRTSESLSVQGSEAQERDLYIQELLQGLKAQDPTDRVTALKELRMLDDPRAIEAVERCKKDSNRVVRMLAEEASQSRKAAIVRPAASSFEGNVMVSSPVSERPKMDWRERRASKLGPELVPWIGLAYLAVGLPLSLACLYLWLGKQGAFDPAALALLDPKFAPRPSQYAYIQSFGIPTDALSLSLAFAVAGFQTAGGLGLMLRRDTGRKIILLFHAALFLFGMFLPGAITKILPGFATVIIVYYLTRPQIVATFKGAQKVPVGPSKAANYGDMERKVW